MSGARSRKTAARKNKNNERVEQKTMSDQTATVEEIQPCAEEGVMSTVEAIQNLCKDIQNLKTRLKQ